MANFFSSGAAPVLQRFCLLSDLSTAAIYSASSRVNLLNDYAYRLDSATILLLLLLLTGTIFSYFCVSSITRVLILAI